MPVTRTEPIEEVAGCTTDALKVIAQVMRPGIESQEVAKGYDNWTDYDKHVNHMLYKGPTLAAHAVAVHAGDNRELSVLDVAAGTGLAGIELRKLGYTHVDALDPSEGMLQSAKDKNLYNNYITEFFPHNAKSSVESSSYDVLICVGGMAEGHMKCDCLPEMVRCVKPGGLVVISVREDYLFHVPEYVDRMEPLMKQLETEGQWVMLERKHVTQYYHTYNGLIFTFRVTKK